jgi:hypothetical protein
VLDTYLQHLLKSRGKSLSIDQVQALKEKCAMIADSPEAYSDQLAAWGQPRQNGSTGNSTAYDSTDDPSASGNGSLEKQAAESSQHELPDGQVVKIDCEGCGIDTIACLCTTWPLGS